MSITEILQKPLTTFHGLIAGIVLGVGIFLIPPFVIATRVEQYQYDNVKVQREIVDKRVAPVEQAVRDLDDRVQDSEVRINAQLADSNRTRKKLEELMYRADPEALKALVRQDLGGVHQTASPTINVSPIITRK
ncbi:hypothetical protein [Pseudomonas viridiflava]|uniref:hypothetical protein n=1 Tax=Pseudomonas viridiflava TaxID=33069 RepID=UPI001BCD515D|nr:hypothetical protein [Pseudomonas viridiflava]QVI88013.1 hypothetical protein KHW14_11965 [Pseudomonas viridiflava]